MIFFSLTLLSFQDAVTHLTELKSKKDFDKVKGAPLTDNFKGIECVKVIYTLSDKKLYYLESRRFKWHYRFADEVLYDPDDLETFNRKNYGSNEGRKYVLCTFNYNVNSGDYFIQFSVADNPPAALLDELVSKIASTFYNKNKFRILLNSTALLARKSEIAKKYSVMTSDELFKSQRYQCICAGKTKGILRIIPADSLRQNEDYSGCILVLKGSSNELPLCRGVITSEFQTPLSHICLLTNNRKTPAAAQKNIFDSDTLAKYEGKTVELIVSSSRLIVKASRENASEISKNVKWMKLAADTVTSAIADLAQLGYADRKAYGAKVCNLAELKKIRHNGKSLETPSPAFAVPFHYYLQHLCRHGIAAQVEKLLKDSAAFGNDSLLALRLKRIRTAIKQGALEKNFLEELTAQCEKYFGRNKKIRFRSSSNCEDEANFNGAGLYTSQTGIIGDTTKSIEEAIKKVWASLWTPRAFKERTFFNVDHSSVYMAVLVHEAFDNEAVNGVAITRNLYRNFEYGFVINMQQGEEEVVSPKPGVVCEQVVSYMNTFNNFYNDNRSADWISFSSLHPSGSLLSSDELMQLTRQLESIKQHFYFLLKNKKAYKDFAMDVEFKIITDTNNKRKILFKQARPYNG